MLHSKEKKTAVCASLMLTRRSTGSAAPPASQESHAWGAAGGPARGSRAPRCKGDAVTAKERMREEGQEGKPTGRSGKRQTPTTHHIAGPLQSASALPASKLSGV